MTVNELLIRVRRKIGDMQKIQVSDDQMIDATNDAIEMLSLKLIGEKDPEMIKTFTLNGQTSYTKPSDFIEFAGNYPVYNPTPITFKNLDSDFTDSLVVRYFAVKPIISNLTDNIPFTKLTHQGALVEHVVAVVGSGQ